MKRSMLFLVAALAGLTLSACGDTDDTSSQPKNDTASYSTAGNADGADAAASSKLNGVLYMDSSSLHSGTVIDGLAEKAEAFAADVKNKYSPEDRTDSADTPAGAYIKLLTVKEEDMSKLAESEDAAQMRIYIPDYNDDRVEINGEYYHTPDGETTKFASELLKYRDEKQ